MRNGRVLITGAGGFVGKRLTARIAAGGADVFAMTRRPPAAEDLPYFSAPNVTILEMDMADLRTEWLPTGIDTLITLAQSSRFREFPDQANDVFDVNVTANLRLLQWAHSSGVKRVVHASSGGIYGGGPGARFSESDPVVADESLGFYLTSKLCAELVFRNFREFFDSMIVLRPFFVYGPGQRPDMFVARIIESVREGRAISLQGADGLKVNPVYVDDAAAAFDAATGLDGAHVINLAGPDVVTLREIGRSVGGVLGKRPVFEHRPGEASDYVARTALAEELLGAPAFNFERGIALTLA